MWQGASTDDVHLCSCPTSHRLGLSLAFIWPSPQGDPAPGSAAEFIVRMARQYPGEVVVLALAALTNVALALHIDPQLPQTLVR